MDTELIYCDDNFRRLSLLPASSIDLLYLDPPFFSNRHYEVIWGDEAEIRSFKDRWEGGIHHYVGWMKERVMEMHRTLKSTGSLYLYCDWHASHYLKQMGKRVVEFHDWILNC
jgi:DNA modification methylase